jgi:Na+-driven multidrug efflux pump
MQLCARSPPERSTAARLGGPRSAKRYTSSVTGGSCPSDGVTVGIPPERLKLARAGAYNAVFLGAVGLGFFVFTGPLVRSFSPEPEVIAIVSRGLQIVSSGFLFYAYGMVLTTAFNGAGDTRTPTVVNLVCFWFFAIPMAYLSAKVLGWGVNGVFGTIAVAYTAQALLAGLLFRRGSWKAQKV